MMGASSGPRESHRNVEYEVEVGHNSEARSGIKKKSYGGTARVARKGEPTKLGYLTFDLISMSIISWRKWYQDSDYDKYMVGLQLLGTSLFLQQQ